MRCEYASSDARGEALPHWLEHYNERRSHSAWLAAVLAASGVLVAIAIDDTRAEWRLQTALAVANPATLGPGLAADLTRGAQDEVDSSNRSSPEGKSVRR